MSSEDFNPIPGTVDVLEPGVRRVLAPNPSPMTNRGTNSYLLGTGKVTLIDPGPDDPMHLAALLGALDPGEVVEQILVTHSHVDHSALTPALVRATGAPVLAFGNSMAGRSDVMQRLAEDGVTGGGEGADPGFEPDHCLRDGEIVDSSFGQIRALWTPGHFCNHMSFLTQDIVFTGDHVMGWASTMISPPDGDLAAFMTSAQRLADLNARAFFPSHGAPIPAPTDRCLWLMDHRKRREAEILAQLSHDPVDIFELTKRVYDDVPEGLLRAAERNVFAHLIDLHARAIVIAIPRLSQSARYRIPH